jgi:hypothetical protein
MSHEEENKQFDKEGSRFGLPEGYFQQSARSVFNKVEWLEEHKTYPLLGSLGQKNPFQVPGSYFREAGQKLELLEYPALAAIKKQPVFTVPEGYFEELEVAVLAKAMDEEEPRLNLLPKQEPFGVKETYFAENAARLEQMLSKQNKEARVIRLFGSRTARVAIAAMLTVALGAWLYRVYAPDPGAEDCGTIACLEKQELLKSKALESMETDELYDLVNSKKLEEKLQNKEKVSGKEVPDSLEDELIDELPDEI